MADVENQVEGVSVQHEQGALPEAQHEPTDAGEKTKGPARLLVVLGDVHNGEQRDLALARVVAGLSSWDTDAAGCDVDEELNAFVKLQPKGITDPTGETIVEHKSELIEIQVLVNPRFQTLQKKLLSFITNESSSSYRFLLYSGLTLQNSGCWFLQDGCFSFSSLVELFHQSKVGLDAAAAKQNDDDSILDLCVVAETGDWTKAGVAKLESRLKIRLNPPQVERNTDGAASFSNYISPLLKTPSCDDLLPSTKAVGNFGQSTATMHVFPAGQGDSALFGVSGFNLLLDGGYTRRSCFWEMVRHLSTLDAIIVSRLGPDNLFGIASFLEKKVQAKEHPELGVVYLNETKNSPAATDSKPSLVISLAENGQSIVDNLRQMATPVLPCLGSVHGQVLHPINLYHKVGHGSVDLYVLSPLNEAKETKMIGGQKTDNLSSSFLVVWRPVSANEKLTRILFPGNTPQAKIFDGLDRLKASALFQNALGVAEKIQGPGKGVEKPTAAASAKPATAKAKPPSGLKAETKDVKKPLHEQKASADQHKPIAPKAAESKEIKKPGIDVKKAIAVSTETKNGKAVGVVKKELPAKATPGPSRIARKSEVDVGKGAKKAASSKQAPAAAAAHASATTGAGEVVKDEAPELVDADKTAAMPSPSEVDAPPPINISPEMVGDDGELSQVHALPDPTAPEEHLAEEVAMQNNKEKLEEEEDVAAVEDQPDQPEKLDDDSRAENDDDSGEVAARGDGQKNVAADKSFDPSKEWGIPDGLPAPVNGKEPAAATAKKTSQSVSIVGPAANAKKPDNTSRNTETKATGKRPTTAPDRLNNTTREEEDKVGNQSMAKGRLSITSSHKDGTSSARGDLKKPTKPVVAFYVDVAYIPGHGNLHYFDVDFFRRVRARNYVLSSINPNVKALALLVEAKQTWEDSNAEVSIIPTYDSESMLSWIQENKDELQKLNIKIGPPAYKCRMQLQELDTSCASYRLEL